MIIARYNVNDRASTAQHYVFTVAIIHHFKS